MRGAVIINGYPSAEKFIRQGQRIQMALQAVGVEVDLLRNGEVYSVIGADGKAAISFGEKYNFAVYLDKDKYLGEALENKGLRLFNSARAVAVCDDKVSTYLALRNSGVRLAKTIPVPLCYTNGAKVNLAFLENVAEELGFPMVVKNSYGSFGKGVQLVHGMDELQKVAQELLHQPHCFQAYINESCGRDIRVIVIGGKALGCMERVAADGEFRSNVELGGQGKTITPEPSYIEAAEKAAKTLGLDYCGVDLLETKDGPILCEVNSNAFFDGFEAVTGFDVAAAYANYILKTLQID